MTDLRIALIQTDLYWQDIPANLAMLDKKVDAISEEVDLIALPEMFSTGFSMEPEGLAEGTDGSAVQWMRRKAAEKNCVITGSLMLSGDASGGKPYYNRLIWMKPDGKYEIYDKKHLFSLSAEPEVYTPGHKRLIQTIGAWRICPMICYDLRFPVWARNAVNENREADYDLLLYVANWPERRVLAWQALLSARAIENLSYAAGVNRIGTDGCDIHCPGGSAVIGPLGEVLCRMGGEAETAIVSLSYDELRKARRLFPFLKDADKFELKEPLEERARD